MRDDSCGRASFRYALSLFGIGFRKGEEITEDKMKWLLPSDPAYDEHDLKKAAKKAGLNYKFHNFTESDPNGFMKRLQECLVKKHACIVTWHTEGVNHFHWVCVAGAPSKDRLIVFDPYLMDTDSSARTFDHVDKDEEEYAPATMSMARFKEWIKPEEDVEDGEDYHFILELWPEKYDQYVPGMVDFALISEMKKAPEIYQFFDEYMDDLRTIFGNPADIKNGESAHEFLLANKDTYENMVELWTLKEYCPASFYVRELKSLIAITKCYDFKIEKSKEAEAIRNLSYYLGWRACEYSYEVGRYED